MTPTDSHDGSRGRLSFEDLDEIAREGRCAMIWWFSQATILLPMEFQYPERLHERTGQELTAHVDAEARKSLEERKAAKSRADSAAFSARVDEYLGGKPADDTLESTLAGIIREAGGAEAKARSRLRRRAHARLGGGAP